MLTKLRASLASANVEALLVLDETNRQYLTGVHTTAGAVLITPNAALFITDFRYIEMARACVKHMIVEMNTRENPFTKLVGEALAAEGLTRVGFLSKQMTVSELEGWRKLDTLELVPTPDVVTDLRICKTADEVEKTRKAQQIAERALTESWKLVRPGMTEKELAAEIVYRMHLYGADKPSFDPIVVAGPNSALPHGVPGDRPFQRGDFITTDIGVQYQGYCSDMTRTAALGEATEEMRAIYAKVLEAQLASLAAVQPGKTGAEVDAVARDIIAAAGYGNCFGHGLGHGTGLDIHEAPTLSPTGPVPLRPGMMVTVEPGIYLPGQFGVRIEDMGVVTENGFENLMTLPKELKILPC